MLFVIYVSKIIVNIPRNQSKRESGINICLIHKRQDYMFGNISQLLYHMMRIIFNKDTRVEQHINWQLCDYSIYLHYNVGYESADTIAGTSKCQYFNLGADIIIVRGNTTPQINVYPPRKLYSNLL